MSGTESRLILPYLNIVIHFFHSETLLSRVEQG